MEKVGKIALQVWALHRNVFSVSLVSDLSLYLAPALDGWLRCWWSCVASICLGNFVSWRLFSHIIECNIESQICLYWIIFWKGPEGGYQAAITCKCWLEDVASLRMEIRVIVISLYKGGWDDFTSSVWHTQLYGVVAQGFVLGIPFKCASGKKHLSGYKLMLCIRLK